MSTVQNLRPRESTHLYTHTPMGTRYDVPASGRAASSHPADCLAHLTEFPARLGHKASPPVFLFLSEETLPRDGSRSMSERTTPCFSVAKSLRYDWPRSRRYRKVRRRRVTRSVFSRGYRFVPPGLKVEPRQSAGGGRLMRLSLLRLYRVSVIIDCACTLLCRMRASDVAPCASRHVAFLSTSSLSAACARTRLRFSTLCRSYSKTHRRVLLTRERHRLVFLRLSTQEESFLSLSLSLFVNFQTRPPCALFIRKI